jgi:hypothetical protein
MDVEPTQGDSTEDHEQEERASCKFHGRLLQNVTLASESAFIVHVCSNYG